MARFKNYSIAIPPAQRQAQSCAVESSAIRAIGYSKMDQRLTVTFNSGRSYAYFGVSPQRYRAFCQANSKGRYLNANIKQYPYRRLG